MLRKVGFAIRFIDVLYRIENPVSMEILWP